MALSERAKFQAFAENVVFLTLQKYREYLQQGAGVARLSTRHANALRRGVREGFLKAENAETLYEKYKDGASAEQVAQWFYHSTSFTRGVRRTQGLAAFYKKAAMYSAAKYAASPESEAYWAS